MVDVYSREQLEWLFDQQQNGRTFSAVTQTKMDVSSRYYFSRDILQPLGIKHKGWVKKGNEQCHKKNMTLPKSAK